MANSSKKRRGAKSRKKAAAKIKPAPVADLLYGGTEPDATTTIPGCIGMLLPEPPAPDIVEELPTTVVDALPDETVQPSASAVTSRSRLYMFLDRIFRAR